MGALAELNGRDPELSARHFHPNTGLLKPTSVPKANTNLLPAQQSSHSANEPLPGPLAKCPQINAANLSASQLGKEPGFLMGSCWHVPAGRVKVALGFCGSQNGTL